MKRLLTILGLLMVLAFCAHAGDVVTLWDGEALTTNAPSVTRALSLQGAQVGGSVAIQIETTGETYLTNLVMQCSNDGTTFAVPLVNGTRMADLYDKFAATDGLATNGTDILQVTTPAAQYMRLHVETVGTNQTVTARVRVQ